MNATGRTLLASALTGVLLFTSIGCQSPNALLRREGTEAMDARNTPEADKKFSQALKQDPTDWKSQYYIGLIRLEEHRSLDAQLAFEQSLTLRPRDKEFTPLILDGLAEAIYQENEVASLSAMLQKAADDYGTVADYLRQAKYLGKVGDVDGAKLAFRKALKFSAADDPQPYLAMADFFKSVGNRQGEIVALRKAYYIEPMSPRLAERFRKYGIVPGPTIALEPKKDEDELLEEVEQPVHEPMAPGDPGGAEEKAGAVPEK